MSEGADLAAVLNGKYPPFSGRPTELQTLLGTIMSLQTGDSFAAAAAACSEMSSLPGEHGETFAAAAILFDFYGACLGNPDAALQVAAQALALNEGEETIYAEAHENAVAALAWLSFATSDHGDVEVTGLRSWVADACARISNRMTGAKPDQQRQVSLRAPAPRPPGDSSPFPDFLDYRLVDGDDEDQGEVPQGGKLVVLRAIGNQGTSDGAKVFKAYGGLVGKWLPLVATPDLTDLRQGLLADYPHAEAVIETITDDLIGQDYVQLRPVVLVGQPGAGKTQLALSILSALGLPTHLFPCGGASDGALGGTARRWSTGEPSTPASLLHKHAVASPGIVLDELDKTATGDTNGRLQDTLLGMLEPLTASRWHDPYLEADVDLSHVVWIGTANSTAGLSGPLRDRCRILRVPLPAPEHLPVLGQALFRRAYLARNQDPRWYMPLDDMELRAVASAWPGGSIRHLARLLEGVVAARNHAPVLN
jgi:hypothetical protein